MDLLDCYSAYDFRDLRVDVVHPSPLGHRVAAHAVRDALCARGWLCLVAPAGPPVHGVSPVGLSSGSRLLSPGWPSWPREASRATLVARLAHPSGVLLGRTTNPKRSRHDAHAGCRPWPPFDRGRAARRRGASRARRLRSGTRPRRRPPRLPLRPRRPTSGAVSGGPLLQPDAAGDLRHAGSRSATPRGTGRSLGAKPIVANYDGYCGKVGFDPKQSYLRRRGSTAIPRAAACDSLAVGVLGRNGSLRDRRGSARASPARSPGTSRGARTTPRTSSLAYAKGERRVRGVRGRGLEVDPEGGSRCGVSRSADREASRSNLMRSRLGAVHRAAPRRSSGPWRWSLSSPAAG